MLVPKKGLEPPHRCRYMDLNHARLPIPPLRLEEYSRCSAGLTISRTALPSKGTAQSILTKKLPRRVGHGSPFIAQTYCDLSMTYWMVTRVPVIQLAPVESQAFNVTRCFPIDKLNQVSTEDALTWYLTLPST